jgi:hypothetical protein
MSETGKWSVTTVALLGAIWWLSANGIATQQRADELARQLSQSQAEVEQARHTVESLQAANQGLHADLLAARDAAGKLPTKVIIETYIWTGKRWEFKRDGRHWFDLDGAWVDIAEDTPTQTASR